MDKVVIIGGGNIGTAMLAKLADSNKVSPVLYTPRRNLWDSVIKYKSKTDVVWKQATNYKVTDNIEEAVSGAKYIFITLPSFLRPSFLWEIKDFVADDSIIVFVPGCGGAEITARSIFSHNIIVGLERVPCVARVHEYGHSVEFNWKAKIRAAVLGHKNLSKEIINELADMFGQKIELINDYLAIVLTPANPIMHPCRMYAITKDKPLDFVFDHQILFYDEWDDYTSELVFAFNCELMEICNCLGLSEIIPLDIHYESPSPGALTAKIRSIEAFKGIKTPMLSAEGQGFTVDYGSRYFTEDFPFGVYIIKSIAEICNIQVPFVDKLIEWYKTIDQHVDYYNIYQKHGISSIRELKKLYS